MGARMNIVQTMSDKHLFGPIFGGDSHTAWRALLSGFYGLPMDTTAQDTFKALTGRSGAPTESHNELWLVVGRRGGKSHAAALIAVFEAAFQDHRDKLAPGEVATVMLLAADRQQARTLLRYVRGFFENPMLKKLVRRETADGLELWNRSAIEIHTASHKAVRGYTLAAAILDEVAFWPSDGAHPDIEVVAALRPALATLNGRLIALSSPYARRGMLWTQYQKHYGKDSAVLVAQAPSRTLNPTLPQRVIDDAMNDDAARASAEYLAQFRSDIEQFLKVETVQAATRPKPLALPYSSGTSYFGFVDPGGGGADEYTLAIGHRVGNGVIVDLVEGRRGNPAAITKDFSAILAEYKINKVAGDRYAGQWVPTAFAEHGITYDPAPGTRSELYATLAPALNAGAVELPPCPDLAKQLVGLERRTTRGGRDIIDHAPNSHDDRANSVAGVVSLAIKRRSAPQVRSLGGDTEPTGRWYQPEQNGGTPWRDGIAPKNHAQRKMA